MTFEETKSLLLGIKNAKQRARNIQADLREIEESLDCLGSSLNSSNVNVRSSNNSSVVERAALRLADKRQELADSLEKAFMLEDKLADAIAYLEPTEQDIIIGCYMRGKVHWKLAEELSYSERSLIRKKNNAILKMSKIL